MEMLGREVPVARLEQLQNPGHRVHRRPPRDPAKAPVVQPLGPLGLRSGPASAGTIRSETPRISDASTWLKSPP